MRKSSMIKLAVLIGLVFSLQTAWAQLPARIPRIPRVETPKPEQPKTDDSRPAQARATTTATHSESRSTGADSQRLYEKPKPPNKPVLVKDSLYIQARTEDSYWKFPNQQNYSSWAPTVKFFVFFDGSGDLNYTAEYFNPDGSSWFNENLEVPGPIYIYQNSGTATYLVQSKYGNTSKLLDTNSSAAIGTYGIKITNPATGEVVFQGKFKVDKFHKP